MHELYSALNKELKNSYSKSSLIENYSKILITMSPIIPHFSDECLQMLNYKNDPTWPKSVKGLLIKNSINYVVQINGKKRSVINSKPDLNEEEILKLVKNDSSVKKFIENKKIKKKIFVKNKLINIII